jgi:soluble lytic murein transglycosylase-like protein
MSDRSALPWIIAAGVGAVALGVAVQDHVSVPFEDKFKLTGDRYAIDPNLLIAIAKVESNFNPAAVSKPNANGTRDYGIMQINEKTAQHYGFDPPSLVDNVGDSLTVAARLLTDVRHELGNAFSHRTLIAAYNAGAPAILARGIFNTVYVSHVAYEWTLYTLGRLFA